MPETPKDQSEYHAKPLSAVGELMVFRQAALCCDRIAELEAENTRLRSLFTTSDTILLEKAANTVEDDELPDALRSIAARLSSLLPPDSP